MSGSHISVRKLFVWTSFTLVVLIGAVTFFYPPAKWIYIIVLPLIMLGIHDMTQTKQTIRRNFPLLGHGRYLMEMIRPEMNQYFIESNTDGMPFSREMRSAVYQRAKGVTDTLPFGTQMNVYAEGYEWIAHSLAPKPVPKDAPRIEIGLHSDCTQPYSAAIYNVSAMSFGALSKNAIMALNKGAKIAGFYHNTGEGGLSPYHLQGGDVVWQIGTGYFSCRTSEGLFDPSRFADNAQRPEVKMIEIKLSQGAKPSHGGILPAAKITPEIAEIRGVMMGRDVISPPAHTAFSNPLDMMEFIARLRQWSGGKPVGFKLCIGNYVEFISLCKAMSETGILPDFITVDGAEGGTGAAPLEFSNSVGVPLNDALVFVHNMLTGFDLRDRIKIIASGKVVTGFHLVSKMAMGADLCNSARGMMFALGCIQALRCNTNDCPTGVATQDPDLVVGLDVPGKSIRVANFQKATVHNCLDLIAAAGLSHPSEVKPHHIYRRISSTAFKRLDQIYQFIERGSMLSQPVPEVYEDYWRMASAAHFLDTPEMSFPVG